MPCDRRRILFVADFKLGDSMLLLVCQVQPGFYAAYQPGLPDNGHALPGSSMSTWKVSQKPSIKVSQEGNMPGCLLADLNAIEPQILSVKSQLSH